MRVARLLILALLLVSCGSPQVVTTTSPVAPTTTMATTTTSSPTTTSTTLAEGPTVLPRALETMPDTWVEILFIPYGETPDTLGTSLGGDGEGIWWGPEYGAQAPDSSWWFLDTANYRLAHFSATGEYLEEQVLPESMLVGGVYFQFTSPRVLTDGTFMASRVGLEGTTFLRLRDDVLDTFSLSSDIAPRTDDGTNLYGFSFGEESTPMVIDPRAQVAEEVEWFLTRRGDRFQVSGGGGAMEIELFDVGKTVSIDFEADGVGGPVYVTLEVVSDLEGTLHLFILGFPERDDTVQLAGYMTVSANGEVSEVEPMRDPFTPSDPGSQARLWVRPGATTPTYMVIDTDGVRVYGRR